MTFKPFKLAGKERVRAVSVRQPPIPLGGHMSQTKIEEEPFLMKRISPSSLKPHFTYMWPVTFSPLPSGRFIMCRSWETEKALIYYLCYVAERRNAIWKRLLESVFSFKRCLDPVPLIVLLQWVWFWSFTIWSFWCDKATRWRSLTVPGPVPTPEENGLLLTHWRAPGVFKSYLLDFEPDLYIKKQWN